LAIVGVAHVEAASALAGDDVRRAGRRVNPADGGDEPRHLRALTLHLENPLGGAGGGIASAGHGGRAGVVGAPDEVEFAACQSDDGVDEADRQPEPVEHRTLFDVEFEISNGGPVHACFADSIRIQSECLDRFTYGDTLAVGAREQVLVDRTGHRPAADEGRAKPNAFFL
jgi:hypothetical protein